MLGYIKIAGTLLFVGFLVAAGWQVHRWRTDAAMAKALAAQLEAEHGARIEAERQRFRISQELVFARENVKVEIRNVVRRIPEYVDRGNCQLSADGVRNINTARGLPPSPQRATHGTIAAGSP